MQQEPKPRSHPTLDVIPWWRSFVSRFVGLYTLVMVGLLLLGIWRLHEIQKREVVDKFGLALESTAATAAPFLLADDVRQIHDNADAQGPAFHRLRRSLEWLQKEHHLREDQVYILRHSPGNVRCYEFVAMLQKKTFVGAQYCPPPALLALYRWVMSARDAVRTPLYTDENGTFISGLAPIVDARGQGVAILQIDLGVEAYLREISELTAKMFVGGGALTLIIFGFGVWTHWYMRRKVEALLRGTGAIQNEDYDYHVTVSGRDELSAVALALNQVIRKLKERFEMLKFLPRHTARMIESAVRHGGVHLESGHRVNVAVIESDIRGFTRISERLRPEEVVKMLNTYIRVQADLIEGEGGSIDKFMGDAVLAIFEGPLRAERAARCALAIQQAVHRMNLEQAFAVPIHVGIGLSLGEVVMGNMGSEHRMEHTVIGSVVNLAARLCSLAGPGEILMGGAVADQAAGPLSISLGQPEQVMVKGFEGPVHCYRLRSRSSATE